VGTDLFGAEGRAALATLTAGRALLAFDLDGTLAPIVDRPGDARVPAATAQCLARLAANWPIAVLTGRTIAEAQARLGFRAHFVYGNHGAQRPGDGGGALRGGALDGCRERLCASAAALRSHGIDVEDKGLSLALHYRNAPDRSAARAWLDSWAATVPLEAAVQCSHGHCVLNVMPHGAADKGDALLEVMRESGSRSALIVGDDENDEPAFAKAPAGSVSVRIGPIGTPTGARFTLESQARVDALLHLLLTLRR
jgi:trehalose 6-phosphate phosphatase